jgi:hypothetical protein
LIGYWAFEYYSPPLMAKEHRKDNLMKAKKLRHNTPDNNPNSQPSEIDLESDCGYERGVNCDSTDDEYDPTDDLDVGQVMKAWLSLREMN